MVKNRILIALAAAGMAVGGCSTYGGQNASLEDVGTGAAIGAAAGAGVGALVDGVSTVEGAAAGAAVGAVAGALSSNDRRWYRDQYGRCYYVDDRGDRVYDNDRRC
jgi:hypothetical protein